MGESDFGSCLGGSTTSSIGLGVLSSVVLRESWPLGSFSTVKTTVSLLRETMSPSLSLVGLWGSRDLPFTLVPNFDSLSAMKDSSSSFELSSTCWRETALFTL